MTKLKHTPGPWKTGEADWNKKGEARYVLHGITAINVADCRLIAAAPDLLEVALDIVSDYNGKINDGLYALALKAIAKAGAA